MVVGNNQRKALNKRLIGCLAEAKLNFGNILEIPERSEIVFNTEQLNEIKCAVAEHNVNNRYAQYFITMNRKYLANNLEIYLNEIIPHETAHIICFHNDRIESGHGDLWRELCITMGGTGEESIKL